MRILLTCLSLCIAATPALPAITPEAFRDLAYAGDIAGAEAAMAEAHRQNLAGELATEDLRAIGRAIATTHPDLWTFTEDWLTANPDSAYAKVLMAMQLNDLAGHVRGERLARDTHPEALMAYRDLRGTAQALAHEAYEQMPDFVPASDAVLFLEVGQRSMDDEMHYNLTRAILERTRDIDTLTRALRIMWPNWGGQGTWGAARYCEDFAALTGVAGYTVDVCVAEWIGTRGRVSPEEEAFAYKVLDETDHPRLLKLKVRRAIYSPAREYHAFLLDWLAEEDNVDAEMANNFLKVYPQVDETREVITAMRARTHERALEDLRHDPYNSKLLELLLGYDLIPFHMGISYSEEQRRDWELRLTQARPFDHRVWYQVGQVISAITEPGVLAYHAPFYANMIYYSDHDMVGEWHKKLVHAAATYDRLLSDPSRQEGPLMSEAEYVDQVLCPGVRAFRVREAVCAWKEVEEGRCFSRTIGDDWDGFVAEATARDLCEVERTAPIDELGYLPQTIEVPIVPGTIANR